MNTSFRLYTYRKIGLFKNISVYIYWWIRGLCCKYRFESSSRVEDLEIDILIGNKSVSLLLLVWMIIRNSGSDMRLFSNDAGTDFIDIQSLSEPNLKSSSLSVLHPGQRTGRACRQLLTALSVSVSFFSPAIINYKFFTTCFIYIYFLI